jgi:hypothetical protein
MPKYYASSYMVHDLIDNANTIPSDNHPFFIDQGASVVPVSNILFTNDILKLQMRIKTGTLHQRYINIAECYTHEMVAFLQSRIF